MTCIAALPPYPCPNPPAPGSVFCREHGGGSLEGHAGVPAKVKVRGCDFSGCAEACVDGKYCESHATAMAALALLRAEGK